MHDHILTADRSLMPPLPVRRVPARRAANLAFLACLFLTGCAETPFVRSSLPIERRDKTHETVITGQMHEDRRTAFYQTPPPAAAEKNIAGNAPPPTNLKKSGEKGVTLNLQSMPLPEFVNAVFGAVLKLNVSIDPQVAQRTDMVSLRSGAPMDADQIFAAAQAVLRSYGIAAQEFNGLVRVVPENSQSGYLPEIRRGRAMPDVPESLRPVFFLVELEHTQSTQAVTWLRTLFGNRVTATEDARRNMILLSGQSDAIRTALEAIQLLDQPQMRGRYSVRIAPVFWSAEEMARRLVDLLTAEGYAASTLSSSPSPVLVVPVAPINSVIVFAANQQILEHTLHWAQELDQTPPSRSGGYITYHVRNVDATDLAATLAQVMGESAATSEPAATPVPAASGAAAVPGAAATPASSAVRQNPGSRVVVNKAGNSIIIKTTPTEYQQWYGLLQELDRPARAALVMATIAEIRLNRNDTFGFNWMLQQFQLHGHNISTGTSLPVLPGTSVEAGTFRIGMATLKGDPRALLSLLSTENRIKVLSNPSLMARNGETATIQVGTDVPILSSQITTPVGNAGGAANPPSVASLQTVQYRQTGVMLKVKPVIHAGGRIEIDVTQEVSLVQGATSESGAQRQQNLTPPVLSRKIDTKVSVSDGNTIVLGGLIQDQTSEGKSGIPFLKDIPYLGALFRTSMGKAVDRTELIVLLTPYVIEDDFDANAITDTFRDQFSWAQEIKPRDLSTKNTGDALTENAVQPPAPVERRPVPGSEASSGTGSEAGNGAGSAGSAGLADTGGSRRFSGGFGEAGAQGAQNSAAPTAVPTTRPNAGVTPEDAPPPSYRSRPYHLTDLSEAKNAAQNARRRSANAAHEQSRIFVPPDDLPKTGAPDKPAAATTAAAPAAAASGAASSAAHSATPTARRSAASGAPASGQQGAATTTPAGTSANTPAGATRNAPAGASPNAASEGGRKPVTDEAMKKELLELMRGAGGAGATSAAGTSSGTSSGK